jgi:hypothetical protein
MIKQTIQLLDETIFAIKGRNTAGSFSSTTIDKVEFEFILCLDIVRYELHTSGKLSDETAIAVSQLFAFRAFEYYHSDFPDLYSKCSVLFNDLLNFNPALKNYDLKGMGVDNAAWIKFFKRSIQRLIE